MIKHEDLTVGLEVEVLVRGPAYDVWLPGTIVRLDRRPNPTHPVVLVSQEVTYGLADVRPKPARKALEGATL